jgi:hypothetical protein
MKVLALVVSLWCSLSGSAQVVAAPTDPLRGTVLVTVRAGGARLAGARVALLSRPFLDDERAGVPDRLELVGTDGEVRARVLRGRPYSVWATVTHADGTTSVTDVDEDVYAGMGVVLTVRTPPRPPLAVQVLGQEPWAALAPQSVRLRALVANVEVQHVQLLGAEPFAVPPLPGDRFDVEIVGAAGQVFARATLHWSKLDGQRRHSITLDPPQIERVFVIDKNTGAGVGGVAIMRVDGVSTHQVRDEARRHRRGLDPHAALHSAGVSADAGEPRAARQGLRADHCQGLEPAVRSAAAVGVRATMVRDARTRCARVGASAPILSPGSRSSLRAPRVSGTAKWPTAT